MNKKTLLGIIIVVVVVVIAALAYFLLQDRSDNSNNSNNNNVNNGSNETAGESASDSENNDVNISDGKVLVVYFSAQGHTEEVANKIAENLNADIFEITPADPYTSDDLDWTDDNSRVSREHDDESLRNVELTSTSVDNWDSYDTVLIGYPIWWGVAAWPVDTFVSANDFTGKTIIPFCTSASSSLGQSGGLLKEEAGTGNWLEGQRFSSNPSDSDIKEWTDSISS